MAKPTKRSPALRADLTQRMPEPTVESLVRAMLQLGITPTKWRYSVDEVCRMLGAPKTRVNRLIEQGHLSAMSDSDLPDGDEWHVPPQHVKQLNGANSNRGRTHGKWVTWESLCDFLARHRTYDGFLAWEREVKPPGVYRTCPAEQGGCGSVRLVDEFTRYGRGRSMMYPICVYCQAALYVSPPVDRRLQPTPDGWIISEGQAGTYKRKVLHATHHASTEDDAKAWAESLGFIVGQRTSGPMHGSTKSIFKMATLPEFWIFGGNTKTNAMERMEESRNVEA